MFGNKSSKITEGPNALCAACHHNGGPEEDDDDDDDDDDDERERRGPNTIQTNKQRERQRDGQQFMETIAP